MATLLCEVCHKNLLEPLRPFVRFYGWSRPITCTYDGHNGLAARQGYDRPDHPVPGQTLLHEGTLEFHAHPIVCADARCIVSMTATLMQADSSCPWRRDDQTYGEPTAGVVARAGSGERTIL